MFPRTPSIWSQDDPLSQVIQAPQSETEQDKIARLQREAEAKRVSEQIDEEIRQDREKLKRSKGDVKVKNPSPATNHDSSQRCAAPASRSGRVGQVHLAETVQVDVQAPGFGERAHIVERYWPHFSACRTVITLVLLAVVYLNIACSIKHIFASLEAWDDAEGPTNRSRSPDSKLSTDDAIDKDQSSPKSQTSNNSKYSTPEGYQIANLRLRLSPLVAAESQLADFLSGGIVASSSGRTTLVVRSGWQTIRNGQKARRPRTTSNNPSEKSVDSSAHPLLEEVANMLDACKDDIQSLWEHPTVKAYIAKRRLKLEAWAT